MACEIPRIAVTPPPVAVAVRSVLANAQALHGAVAALHGPHHAPVGAAWAADLVEALGVAEGLTEEALHLLQRVLDREEVGHVL
ncbi:hypothetical protein F8S13_22655 [Chloroflexia bacterium SDU3-3]|nr:hypothetical protein F8S13_22655 [Chloroflexia bacterium SDU3-3]